MRNIKDVYALDLQMFATAANTTTSVASGNDLSPEMKTFYSDYLIDLVGPQLVHDQFGQKHPIPKNGGKTIEFRKYEPLGKAMTPLTEGVTPEGQALNVSTVTATVDQYGGWIQLPDMLLLTAIDNNMVEATKLLADQAGRTLDSVTREVLNGGTNVQYHNGTVASRNALAQSHTMDVDCIFRAVRALKAQNARPIDGSFVGIIHPDVAYDLMRCEEWIEAQKYTGNVEKIYDGEIGKIGGVRFVETSEAKIFAKAGASGTDVYSTLIIGANAYGVTDVAGGGLQHIVKQLGSGGAADPLNQRASAGWKAVKTAERLVEQYMIRIETGCTFNSGAN